MRLITQVATDRFPLLILDHSVYRFDYKSFYGRIFLLCCIFVVDSSFPAGFLWGVQTKSLAPPYCTCPLKITNRYQYPFLVFWRDAGAVGVGFAGVNLIYRGRSGRK